VQSALNRSERGTLEIFEAFAEGLAGLDGFDYVWLLSWLGDGSATSVGADSADSADNDPATERPPLTQVPFLLRPQQRSMGVFATRGPRRVNPIGLSLVRLLAVSGREVSFAGVDLVDGTPVIDLKPYVTRFDSPPGQPRCGWFDELELTEGVTPADLEPPIFS
jgi:tRNA (adenine37-N6)-methyltransferase